MAAVVLDVYRPMIEGTASASEANDPVEAQYIVAVLDLDNDGRRDHRAVLPEADYAGIIAEWETGTATTVLDAALVTYLAALTAADPITAAQQSWIGTSKAWP